MTRRSHRRSFDVTDFDTADVGDVEADPMSSVANLVDAMLVFACGLMMAVVVRYNVDLSDVQDVNIDQDLTHVDNIEELKDQIESGGAGYTELGTVYQDPSTGEMYMITQDGAESTDGEGGSGSESGSDSGSDSTSGSDANSTSGSDASSTSGSTTDESTLAARANGAD